MDFSWSEAQLQYMKSFADFGREQVAPRARTLSEANEFDQQSWQKLNATDFYRMVIPVAYGGLGKSWWDFTAALYGLASTASDGGFILTVIGQAGFIYGLSQSGTESQKALYFPRLLAGALTATAIAEPQSGTDTRNLQTTATESGGGYTLNGEKYNIAHAPGAEIALVLGRVPALGNRDSTVFIVEKGMEGFSQGNPESKMGNRTLPTSWLRFADTRLEIEHVLGLPGEGMRALGQVATLDRIYWGLMGSALLQPVLKDLQAQIQTRESFGKPLAQYQHVQRKITDVILASEQAKWVSLAALGQFLSGDAAGAMAGSIAKIVGTAALVQSAQDLLSLLGSRGYQTGVASHLMRDALGFLSVGGTEEAHRMNVFNFWMRLGG